MGEQLDQAARMRALAPVIGGGERRNLVRSVQGKTNQRVVRSMASYEECDAKVVVVKFCLVLFQFLHRGFVMHLSFFRAARALGNFCA